MFLLVLILSLGLVTFQHVPLSYLPTLKPPFFSFVFAKCRSSYPTKSESEVAQSCPTLCDHGDHMDCIRLLHPWDFPGKSTRVDCHFLLQGIFPTQGSNPSLLHWRWILYHLSRQGSPKMNIGWP